LEPKDLLARPANVEASFKTGGKRKNFPLPTGTSKGVIQLASAEAIGGTVGTPAAASGEPSSRLAATERAQPRTTVSVFVPYPCLKHRLQLRELHRTDQRRSNLVLPPRLHLKTINDSKQLMAPSTIPQPPKKPSLSFSQTIDQKLSGTQTLQISDILNINSSKFVSFAINGHSEIN
jgi:hypothetical protein